MNILYASGAENKPIFLGAGGFYPDAIVISSKLSQSSLDATINHIYEHRHRWPRIDGRPLDISKVNSKPSGTYQAPTGFVHYLEDGNPASPLERIFVLAHNYKWIITYSE